MGGYDLVMTDKEAVLDAVRRMPDDASLVDISEELKIMAAIRRGRADIATGKTKTHAEAVQLVKSWATEWTSK
jgi:predicted transcriptional regulator